MALSLSGEEHTRIKADFMAAALNGLVLGDGDIENLVSIVNDAATFADKAMDRFTSGVPLVEPEA